MNLKELSSPIRMYWDVGPVTGSGAPDHGRIAKEIIANKVLSLQIIDLAPTLSTSTRTILETLNNSPVAVSLVAPRTAFDAPALELLKRLPVRLLLVSTPSLSELGLAADLAGRTKGKPAVGVSFPVNRANYKDLPAVLAFCIENKLSTLVLPMQRLMTDEPCFSLSADERQELTERLTKVEQPAWLKIIIHDPFLWRTFFPAVEFPDGGCQAANTMLYISPEGDVYPCPTLPVRIGSLLSSSLKEIIFSDKKKDLRTSLLNSPDACADCGELDQCKGGCRGRTYAMRKTVNEPDPACR